MAASGRVAAFSPVPVAARLAHHLNRLPGAPREFSVAVSAATGTGLNAATLPEAAMETFAAGCG
jgi:hypothetical protein